MSTQPHPDAATPPPQHLRGPGWPLRLLEVRAPLEVAASLALIPWWPLAPSGDGHSVLVLPGLVSGDGSTALLRQFLAARGWRPQGWGQGLNRGLRDGVMDGVARTLQTLAERSGRPVSLVGWSLGGVIARELAKQHPERVRCVITLGSPFTGHPRQTNAWRLYEWASGHPIGSSDLHLPLRDRPPVPTTSIYSRTDGVVSWRCSVERAGRHAENIEVPASHLGLANNPWTLYAVADRLAQPQGEWQPMRRDGWRALWFPPPATAH